MLGLRCTLKVVALFPYSCYSRTCISTFPFAPQGQMMGFLRFALQRPRLFVRFALCFMVAAFPVFASAEEPAHISGESRLAVGLPLSAQQSATSGNALDSQGHPVAASDKDHPPQLSGTVTDPSGAVIAGATVQARSTKGTVQITTHTDANGFFSISGLSAGDYRLVISSPGFETKEVPVTIGSTEASAPLNVSLAVSTMSTTVNVQGREDSLLGIADSATQGTVGAKEIEDRPILRSGEVLETIPGMIITQHAGGGKANQYFLRGFNLDHGTDFAIFVDGMPLNIPSHAHGEGYSDMNSVIPEFVRRVNYEKGPYYADVGNYGSVGSSRLEFFKTLPENFIQVEGGMYGYARGVFGVSQKLGSGNLLYGVEAYHDNGPWDHPDDYYKFNGILTYSRGDGANGFSTTARGYYGKWNSSDQIAVNAVPLVGFYGTLDPSDGANSQRYSLQGEWHRQGTKSASQILVYGFYYDLDLFSNFTYYLTDLVRGDQFEQQDRRWVAGLDARHAIYSEWFGRKVENTFGLQIRNDWIQNGLYQSENRVRVDKTDSETGNTLPATTQADRFTDTQVGLYWENNIQWAERLRSVVGLRGDLQYFDVTSLVNLANSGTASKFLPSPKLSLIFGPWSKTDFYVQGGFGFHSNDGRGTTQTAEPISGENPYPNTPAAPIPPLIPTKGAEIGVRTLAIPHLQSTLSLWYLHSASELQQSGDTGGTTASRQPSNRYGVEWANYYTPLEHVAFDFDLADSRAFFTTIDPDDAAPGSPGGKHVPEAVEWVISSGITLHDYKGWSTSLRLRAFGPRDLTSDGTYRSSATLLLNAEVRYQINNKWRVSAEFFNLLDSRDHDIDYAYESRITPTATAAFTDVFHPVEPFQVRFSLVRTFGRTF
jgi:TonB dependent receptor/Carboxypeptidase regulatory-like domain/TonB-dependent Receptor Plug Domain